jgi:hypothetical protein
MRQSQKIRDEINSLKWTSTDGRNKYRSLQMRVRPVTDEDLALAKSVGKFLRHQRRQLRNPATAMRREKLQMIRKYLGREMRSTLIAYGIARGVPYSVLESSVRDENKPNAKRIVEILSSTFDKVGSTDFSFDEELVKKYLAGDDGAITAATLDYFIASLPEAPNDENFDKLLS